MNRHVRYRISGAVCAVLLFCLANPLWSQTAEQIVRELDKRQQFDSMYAEGSMSTDDRFGTKTSTYRMWSRGSEDFLIEFTNVEEAGQKILRIGNELYLYYPDAEDIIPMHGSALKQSMFGDVSYEDLTEGGSTLDKYRVTLLETVQRDEGGQAWRIQMDALSRRVPYPRQIILVDSSDYVLLEAEYYARSGKLIKTVDIKDVLRQDNGKYIITGMELADQLRKNSRTSMTMQKVETDPQLSDQLFSLESLF